MTQGQLIDKLYAIREQIRELNKQVDALSAEKKSIEDLLVQEMDTQGVNSVSGKQATAFISETVAPAVEDWDSFFAFIRRNNAFYLLQRRANADPYRELLEQRRGKPIPGVSKITLRTLNLRAK